MHPQPGYGHVIPVNIPTTAVSLTLIGRECRLHTITLRETTGAAAADVDILDGPDAGASVLATITLNGGQSMRDSFGAGGLYACGGIALRVNSGSVRGAIGVHVL